jgi:hypothetical protein
MGATRSISRITRLMIRLQHGGARKDGVAPTKEEGTFGRNIRGIFGIMSGPTPITAKNSEPGKKGPPMIPDVIGADIDVWAAGTTGDKTRSKTLCVSG